MEAKVKSEHRWKTVMAFGGVEFVKSEFRKVPAGFEKEAQAHPFLEVKSSFTLTNNLVNGVQAIEVIEPIVGETVEPVEFEAPEEIQVVVENPVEEVLDVVPLTDEEKKARRAAKAREARADKKAKGG